MQPFHLLPMPRKVEWTGGSCAVGDSHSLPIEPIIDPQALGQPQGYRLILSPDGIQIIAHDPAGAFYARCTLNQLLVQRDADDRLPAMTIDDWPDFAQRGVMLDISRDRVPTMATLFHLVDQLASYKINQFQLYTEHTFAYTGHEVVWRDASPMTPEQVQQLDAYCRERFVELVPNQNSFGHMHRWLTHEPYQHLAEAMGGWRDPAGQWIDEPFSLCPIDPGSVELMADLYEQLLPNFTSPRFNVGCDETWDVCQGRSRQTCRQRGEGRVYLDHLLNIHRLVRQQERTMMFWGDIIVKYPRLISELPRDVIALEWGYESDHPFDERCAHFADAQIPFYVCPGTSSWNSFAGRTENMIANQRGAAEAGLKHGAIGYLNTDWGDHGHWQTLPVSYAGYACGAAMSWCAQTAEPLDLPAALDRFAFHDSTGQMGRAMLDLGQTSQVIDPTTRNRAVLFNMMLHGSSIEPLDDRITLEDLGQAQEMIDRSTAAFRRARINRDDAELLRAECQHAASLLAHGCRLARTRREHDGIPAGRLPELQRRMLAENLAELRDDHDRLWLRRSRPGGMDDSRRVFDPLAQAYAGGV
jgi:hypothetical protein